MKTKSVGRPNWIYSVSGRAGVVFHSDGARLSLRNGIPHSQGISVARDKIVFNMGEITGNFRMTELARGQK